jgi:hypothetical protein
MFITESVEELEAEETLLLVAVEVLAVAVEVIQVPLGLV